MYLFLAILLFWSIFLLYLFMLLLFFSFFFLYFFYFLSIIDITILLKRNFIALFTLQKLQETDILCLYIILGRSILNYNFNVARLDPTPLGWFIFTIYKHFTLNTRIIVFLNLIILYCYSLPWKVIKKLI